MTTDCDFLVIGAGVSGAAAAWELAALGKTILLEMEDQPGYHSSGRSVVRCVERRRRASPSIRC